MALNPVKRAKLQAFHMRNQRRILQIKWDDFVTNEEVTKITGLSDVRTTVGQRRIRLFGHVISSYHLDLLWRPPPSVAQGRRTK